MKAQSCKIKVGARLESCKDEKNSLEDVSGRAL